MATPFLGEDRQLQEEVFRKPTHNDQYLLFDSHHPLQHKLGVCLQHRAKVVPTSTEGKEKEEQRVQKALSVCGDPKWAFNKTKRDKKQDNRESEPRRKGVNIPYLAGVSEKLQRILRHHEIPVYFKPTNTLRQELVHPKSKTPSHKQSNVVYSIQCSEDCSERYIGETKQPLHKRMYQHRRESQSGPSSAVHLHLETTGHSFEDREVQILGREKNWFKRGVKRANFVKQENPFLNRNGGLTHHLSPIYNSNNRTSQVRSRGVKIPIMALNGYANKTPHSTPTAY